jgi:hypothetical protein
LLVLADEIDDVAARLAPEACETLPVNVDKEARSAIGVEWTQTLPAMRAGPLELDSSALDNLDQPISQLDLAYIPVPIVCGSCHGRPASALEVPFAE